MALLKYDINDYNEKQLALHTLRMRKSANRIGVLFRSYVGEVVQNYKALGVPMFPAEFNENLEKLLIKEYGRTADVFSNFHEEYLTLTPKFLREAQASIEQILDDEFPSMAREQAALIASVTQTQLMRSVEKARVEDNIHHTQEARLIQSELTARIGPRALVIASTETTRISELSKKTELNQVVSNLTKEEVKEVYVDELSDEDMGTVEAMGAGAALSAGILLVSRTWNAQFDNRTRLAHAAADGQQITGPNEYFNVGGERLSYPGDKSGSAGNVINCRCFLVYDT